VKVNSSLFHKIMEKPLLTVSLLDDDPSVLKAVERLLKAEGFEVKAFGDPVAFLTAVAKARPRVAILDVAMPRMNGLEVQAALRESSPETRVVFVSGQSDDVTRSAALENGAVDFLGKPVDADRLLGALRRALSAAS
jgi:FixJ family two-component response regulator